MTARPHPLRAPRRGATLVELLVALTMLALLTAAVADVVARQWRAHAAMEARRAARAQLVAAADALRPALRMAAGDGEGADPSDLQVVSDTLVELRTVTGASVVCTVVDARTVELPPLGSVPALTWWRSAPRADDVTLLHDDAPTGDTWIARDVELVGTTATPCSATPFAGSAEPGYRLRLRSPLPTTVGVGTPLRFERRVRWIHYRAGDGLWYLGQREWDGSAWTVTQPVAGPLRAPGARGGMSVTARDSAGGVVVGAAVATRRVRRIDVVLRADVPAATGRPGVRTVDSVAFVVAPRNGG